MVFVLGLLFVYNSSLQCYLYVVTVNILLCVNVCLIYVNV